jgi:hypothetical protein
MKRTGILCLASIVTVGVVAYISAKAGYRAGLADAPGRTKSPDAAYIVTILDRVHAGDTNMAATLLESMLDSCLVDRWAYDRRGQRAESFLRSTEISAIPALVGVGAQYRSKHPSLNTSEKTQSAIAEVVKTYAPLAPGLPN